MANTRHAPRPGLLALVLALSVPVIISIVCTACVTAHYRNELAIERAERAVLIQKLRIERGISAEAMAHERTLRAELARSRRR